MIPEIVRSQKLPKKATQNQGFNIIDSMASKLRSRQIKLSHDQNI